MLALDIVLPLVVVQISLHRELAPVTALAIAAVFPVTDDVKGIAESRKVSIMAAISLAAILMGAGLSLFTGNARFALLKDPAFALLFGFNVEPPVKPLLFWEPYLKRLRVVVDGQTIADSRSVIALHETGEMMRLCVPWSDIRREIFVPGSTSASNRTAPVRSWSAKTARGMEDAVAQPFEALPVTAAALQNHRSFDFEKVDAWYLEDELGYASAPIRVMGSIGTWRSTVDGLRMPPGVSRHRLAMRS